MGLLPGDELLLAIIGVSLLMGLIGMWRGVGFASAAMAAFAMYFFLGTVLVLPMVSSWSSLSHPAFYWIVGGVAVVVLLSPILVIWHRPNAGPQSGHARAAPRA